MLDRLLLLTGLCLPLLACDDGPADTDTDPPTEADRGPLDAQPDGAADDGFPPDLAPRPDSALDRGPDEADLGPDASDSGIFDPDSELDAERPLDARPDVIGDMSVDATPDAAPDLAPDGPPPPPRERCFGGEDEDGDGLIDCADPDCRPAVACFEAREDCGNGVDDDGDLRADCDDRYCLGDPRCPPPDVEPYTTAELQDRFDFECHECHGPVDPFSSLDLTAPFEDAVVDVLSVQTPLSLVKTGDRTESFLYLKITFHHLDVGGDGEGMPPAFEGYPPWSAADAERLGLWIDGLQTN